MPQSKIRELVQSLKARYPTASECVQVALFLQESTGPKGCRVT